MAIAASSSRVLIMAGLAIEHNRANPMLMTRWLGSGVMILSEDVAAVATESALAQTEGYVRTSARDGEKRKEGSPSSPGEEAEPMPAEKKAALKLFAVGAGTLVFFGEGVARFLGIV